jgi:predicted transposase YbfD/YdcC
MPSEIDPNAHHNSFMKHFIDLPDPRIDRTKKHLLVDVLFIALAAVICGADGFAEMEDFGQARVEWFREYLKLPNGIPSHDTFARVFARLNPEAFSQCFLNWMAAVQEITQGRVVAIDGKTLRHSFDTAAGNAAIHMVTAFAAQNSLVLGQFKVDQKTNEIKAIPQLLKMLDLRGCIVTIDAMGTQKAIAEDITKGGADYILAVKDNQPNLHEDIKAAFNQAISEHWRDAQDLPIPHSQYTPEVEKNHGRIETRTCWAMKCPDWVHSSKEWSNLNTIAAIRDVRQTTHGTTVDFRYYISSLPPDAKLIGPSVRSHWAIENQLHWALDVTFREDESRIRKDHAPQNMATLRHIALNLLREEKSTKLSLNRKRHLAGWDPTYVETILFGASSKT